MLLDGLELELLTSIPFKEHCFLGAFCHGAYILEIPHMCSNLKECIYEVKDPLSKERKEYSHFCKNSFWLGVKEFIYIYLVLCKYNHLPQK